MTVNPAEGKLKRARMTWEADFTLLPNAWLRDKRLSFTARGILAWLQSHDAEFAVTIAGMVAQSPHGKDAIRVAVNELERYGYLKRYRERVGRGRLGGTVWEQLDPFAEAHPTRNQLDMAHLLPISSEGSKAVENPRSEPMAGLPTQVAPTQVAPTQVNPPTIENQIKEISKPSTGINSLSNRAREQEQNPRPAPARELTDLEQAAVEQLTSMPCPKGSGTGFLSRHTFAVGELVCALCGLDANALITEPGAAA